MITSQNDTAPKLTNHRQIVWISLITSQNDTAPKPARRLQDSYLRLITSQNDTAPKLEDYRLFTKVTWDEVSYAYWEEHYKALSIPFYDADTTEAEKILRELQHKWLMENAQRYGYNYYVK